MRRSLAALVLSLVALASRPLAAQDRAVRFDITAVVDTTVTFRVGRLTWVVQSPRTIVVDPRRRDALIARIMVVSVSSAGEATAVITGQTARVTTDHIVVATEPPRRWYRNTALWFGAVFGLIAGFGLGRI